MSRSFISVCFVEYSSKFKIVFIIYAGDEVDRYQKGNFKKQVAFVIGVTKCLHANKNDTKVGVVTYADAPYLRQDHNSNSSQADLENALENLNMSGKGRHLGKALQLTKASLFNHSNGNSHYSGHNVVVIITDDASDDDFAVPSFALRQHNVTIFSVGVGRYRRGQLNEMASEPNSRHVFAADDYDGLGPLMGPLKDAIIKGNYRNYL